MACVVDEDADVSPARIAGTGACALVLSVEISCTGDSMVSLSGGKPTDDARGETGALRACRLEEALGACRNAVAVPCAPRRPFTVVTGGGLDSARLCLRLPLAIIPPPSLDRDPSLFFPNASLSRRFAKAEEPLLEEVEALETWADATGRFGRDGEVGGEEGRPTDMTIAFPEFASCAAIAPDGVRRGVRSGVSEGWEAPEAGTPLVG